MIHREDMRLPTSVGAVLGKLRHAGYEAYIVGGSVREIGRAHV